MSLLSLTLNDLDTLMGSLANLIRVRKVKLLDNGSFAANNNLTIKIYYDMRMNLIRELGDDYDVECDYETHFLQGLIKPEIYIMVRTLCQAMCWMPGGGTSAYGLEVLRGWAKMLDDNCFLKHVAELELLTLEEDVIEGSEDGIGW